MIAYDYETTRIKAGTPRPLYLTAYGSGKFAAPSMALETPIRDMRHLQGVIVEHFLSDDLKGCKFVAWNGNNFDAYFTAAAMVTHPDYVMRPYLTRNNSLRGLKILRAEDVNVKNALGWEFLDGIAMLGLVGVSLQKFLDIFAPHLPKLANVIDFEREEFNPRNRVHCDYAMRDSEGLEYGINRAQQILIENCDQPLAVTMGGACIKILKAHLPHDTVVSPPNDIVRAIVRQYALRGGFCYCVRRYEGPVWKYDLNQAYAAAMRDAQLPAGKAIHTKGGVHYLARAFIVRLEAWKPDNIVPFYCRAFQNGRLKSIFATTHIPETWVCSNEVEQLEREGWKIKVHESYAWGDVFTLKDYVNKLERWRGRAAGGPSGAEGTVAKNVGNHSYGKMLEELDGVTYCLAAECPEGFVPSYPDDSTDPIQYIYEQHDDDILPKDYHQPQIGAFITAHVRMVVRRAALLAPRGWLYADTDCVVFDCDVTNALDIDPKRYGAWKIEESGTEFQIIAKKVYVKKVDEQTALDWDNPDDEIRKAARAKVKGSAKGLHVKKISPAQFAEWLAGKPPEQEQVQKQNFLKVMQGAEMFRLQKRKGTAVEQSTG